MDNIFAISPIDGRYRKQVDELKDYFSEYALIKYRVKVEIEYFKDFDKSKFEAIRDIYRNFSLEDALEVKEIEKVTNHDVKAVEYLIRRKFDRLNLQNHKEFIHFGLTSQDINNTSIPLTLKDCHENILMPLINEVVELIQDRADEWKDIPMLAHTHGQPASPTIQIGRASCRERV